MLKTDAFGRKSAFLTNVVCDLDLGIHDLL